MEFLESRCLDKIRAEKLDMLRSDPAAGAVAAWYAKNYTKASEWIDVKSMSEFELKRSQCKVFCTGFSQLPLNYIIF